MEQNTETRLQGKSETTAVILGIITALLLATFIYMLATRDNSPNVQVINPNAAGGLTIEDVNNASDMADESTESENVESDNDLSPEEEAMDNGDMEDMDSDNSQMEIEASVQL